MCHFFEEVSVVHINKLCRRAASTNNPSMRLTRIDSNQSSRHFKKHAGDRNWKVLILNFFLQKTTSGGERGCSPDRPVVVVYIRKTQFSRDKAQFSMSYEMNDRK